MNMELISKIKYSIDKFNLDLKDKIILTEGATGDYISTPIIADLAGAKRVYAFEKESSYGSFEDIERGFREYFKYNPNSNIKLIKSLDEIEDRIDIVTNVGLLRPIDKRVFDILDDNSVISLMYEPWEFREEDIDLELALKKGIRVYGTNESDEKLKTMEYIGYTALYHLLDFKISPFSNKKILIVGNKEFTKPIERVLKSNGYRFKTINDYIKPFNSYDKELAIIVAEHKRPILIVGESRDGAFINKDKLSKQDYIIHICGNVDFNNIKSQHKPQNPKPFGYMSYRTDYIDSQAVVDLHTAGLLVGAGMLEANRLNLPKEQYKKFMEQNYIALAFEDKRFW